MSVNLIPPILREKRPSEMAKLSIVLNAYIAAIDVMRYNEFEYAIEDVARLYGAITGNSLVVDMAHKSGMNQYRDVMYVFIRQQLMRFIDNIISHILSNSTITSGVTKIEGCPVIMKMPISDLRLKEYEILNKCDLADKYAGNYPNDHNMLTNVTNDLQSILHGLIDRFNAVKNMPGYDKINRKPAQFDYSSTKILIMLGHLIGHVARTVLISKTYFDTDYPQDKAELEQQLVYDEYSKYSNMGSMSIAGILCCFKREELLPIAVISPSGSLREIEKELLLNMFVLGKLV